MNECQTQTDPCQGGRCLNTIGSYYCECRSTGLRPHGNTCLGLSLLCHRICVAVSQIYLMLVSQKYIEIYFLNTALFYDSSILINIYVADKIYVKKSTSDVAIILVRK